MADQRNVIVHVRCHNLPGARFGGRTSIRLGIQKGKQVIEDVPADVEGVTFAAPFRVAVNAGSGQPNFLGEFAHGTPEARFIYLCWGERVGERLGHDPASKDTLETMGMGTVRAVLDDRQTR